MDRIFNADNGFFRGVNKFVDCIGLSVCFLICNIPLIVICGLCIYAKNPTLMPLCLICAFLSGPAFCGIYYAVVKNIRNSHGYAWPEFWHGFKSSFKQGSLSCLLVFFLLLLMGFDLYYLYAVYYQGALGPLCYFFILVVFIILLWSTTLFSYIARFEDTTKVAMKNSLLIAIANLPKTFVQTVILAAFAFVTFLIWPLVFITPALYMLLKSFVLETTFRKYMSEEDRTAEEEKNRDYKN